MSSFSHRHTFFQKLKCRSASQANAGTIKTGHKRHPCRCLHLTHNDIQDDDNDDDDDEWAIKDEEKQTSKTRVRIKPTRTHCDMELETVGASEPTQSN